MNEKKPATQDADTRSWLFWDGNCGVCCWWVNWARERGGDDHFRMVPYQEAPSPPMTEDLRRKAARAIQVITPDQQHLEAGRACIYIMDRVGRRVFADFWGGYPMIWVFELGYRILARNRGLVSRFLSRNPAECKRT